MRTEVSRWIIGLIYIVAVAGIWIAASYVVQSVVDEGISPFLITYICNSLFIVYIPLVEASRYLENYNGKFCFWRKKPEVGSQELARSEEVVLLGKSDLDEPTCGLNPHLGISQEETNLSSIESVPESNFEEENDLPGQVSADKDLDKQLDSKGRWTRSRVARVSLLICPFWFLAQLTFNLSLKYTTVTSNTILSTSSSLFTFMLSLAFLGEKFTWLKLMGVLLCMGGTIIVSLGDKEAGKGVINSNPILGDILSLSSAGLYAVYITLIRKKLPDDEKSGQVSMAQFLGYLGFFNMVIFLPVVLVLQLAKVEFFTTFTWKQFGLIIGKGLLDNVLSDYLWAKAVLLTTTTVATAGLTIQVPLAALVDTLVGNAPNAMDYIGAAAVMAGFAGINIPSDVCSQSEEVTLELENRTHHQNHVLSNTTEEL
ncbi:thiamine-repressible mitochondrial transport protein THI74-like [Chenopodium quinoa]|uniref:EamA domain-containing protein n=1 Tax=Chenopodium quinoa TaxID=63459 RepID=A0A803LAL5_CHEQI|nr:thiamine-repressible mitochondrial transport protein THI74-like [Chenopodium quinoa]XP_021763445.1 thiamine-repressible mitochondrial transport protein THI74-like [Chenopodium quinoa]